MNNKKTLGILSFVLALLSLLSIFIPVDSLSIILVFITISFLVSIVSIILGFIGKKKAKGFGIAGIVIGLIAFLIIGLEFAGLLMIRNLKNCVDKGNGSAVCRVNGQDMEVPINYLKDSQMK